MKAMKKILSLTFALVMLASLLAGCGGNDPGNVGDPTTTDDYMELTMYLVGDKPEGFDEVYAKINEILKEKVNATVKVEWLSWSEHGTKYSLLFSGSQDFDMIFTAAQWCHYEQTVALGGFAELTEDLLKTYAPDVWNTYPEVAWKQATHSGGVYMIPANFVEVNQDVLAFRGDLMQKYGYDDINSYDQMIEYFEKCAADGIYGAAEGGAGLYWLMFESLGYYTLSGTPSDGQLVLYNYADPSNNKFEYILDWEPFVEFCHEAKKLADAGCWGPDVLNATADRQDGLLSGRGASMTWNAVACRPYANQTNATNPDWNVNLYNIMPDVPYRATSYANGGIGFNANSKKLERALMVYNEFATNPEIQDLAQLGIKGTHWNEGEGNTYVPTDTPYDGSNYWGWRNMDIMRTVAYESPTAVDKKVDELDAYFKAHLNPGHALDSFTFNQEPVATQCAAIDAVKNTYLLPLLSGLVPDVDATLAEYRAALDAAGMQDVLAEIQKQVDEYLAG